MDGRAIEPQENAKRIWLVLVFINTPPQWVSLDCTFWAIIKKGEITILGRQGRMAGYQEFQKYCQISILLEIRFQSSCWFQMSGKTQGVNIFEPEHLWWVSLATRQRRDIKDIISKNPCLIVPSLLACRCSNMSGAKTGEFRISEILTGTRIFRYRELCKWHFTVSILESVKYTASFQVNTRMEIERGREHKRPLEMGGGGGGSIPIQYLRKFDQQLLSHLF